MSQFSLSADVYSPDQLGIVLWELGNVITHLRDGEVRAHVSQQAPEAHDVHTSALLINVLHAAGVKANDRPALEQLQREIQAVREQAPVVHLMLAALPNKAMKRSIVEWFRGEVHPYLLMTFAARSDIGGGFVLRAGSKQYDFSFRGQILANKHRISEIFSSVR